MNKSGLGLNCEFSLGVDSAVIECCPLVLVVANGTCVWQQYNFIWCSLALLRLQSPCTCLLLHLYFICADKFSEAQMTAAVGIITEVCSVVSLLKCHCLGYFCLLLVRKIKKKTKVKVLLKNQSSQSGFRSASISWTLLDYLRGKMGHLG